MELIPEWAPNIHPLLVHFPIALFIIAVIMDIVGYFLPNDWWDEKKNLILFALSGIAAIGTYFSGKEAADSVFIEAEAQNVLTEHADWAEYTVWFMALYALLRIGVFVWGKQDIKVVRMGLTLVSVIGVYMLFQTSDRGAQMVYKFGVGVQDQISKSIDADDSYAIHDETHAESTTTFNSTKDGNWAWDIGENAIADLNTHFHWLKGNANDLNTEAVQTTSGSYALTFSGKNLDGFFVDHGMYEKVQVDYYVDISAFDGIVKFTNNVVDALNYDFVSIASDGTVKQGRISNGNETIFEEGITDVSNLMFIRVVGNGTHFRGYVNKEMIVHGHGDAPTAGSVGVQISGNGTVVLEKMSLTKL